MESARAVTNTRTRPWAVAAALVLGLSASLLAQEPETTEEELPPPEPSQPADEQVQERLQALEEAIRELRGTPAEAPGEAAPTTVLDRIAALEQVVRDLKAAKAAPKAEPPAAAATEEKPDLEKRVETLEEHAKNLGIKVSGSLAVTYGLNFEGPDSRANRLRVFDIEDDEFNVNLLDIILEKPVDGAGTWGFRADLDAGEDAAIFQAFGFNDGDNFELEQAFVEWVAPVGTGLTLRLGKFVTSHGAEVIESADNWNTSRSFLFGFAIPFTHTGLLATYAPCEQLTLSAGVVNGWDNVDDNNDGKTFHGMAKWVPCEKFNVVLSGTYGAEQAGDNGDHRGLLTALFTYQACDDLTLMLDVNYAGEEGAATGRKTGEDAQWYGVAAYARYRVSDAWYVAARAEVFDDDDGARMGVVGQTVEELTFTGSWKPFDFAEVRLEYRHDWADINVFDDASAPANDDEQDTLSLEVIYRF